MSDNPFDRTAINARERPVSSDINQAQSQWDRTVRYLLDQLLVPRVGIADERAGSPVSGFIGDGFKVREDSPAGLSVVLAAGQGFQLDASDTPSNIGGVPEVDDLSRYKPLPLLSDVAVNIPTPDPTNDRIDIVEVAFFRRLADPTSRDVLNTTTGVFDPTVVNKTLAWNMENDVGVVTTPANSTTAVGYKAGVPSGSPAIPPTTPGYLKIAQIAVGNGVAQIDQQDIQDLRKLLAFGGIQRVSMRVDLDTGSPPPVMEALTAPPGILVVANIAGGGHFIYVFAGDVAGKSPVAQTGVGITGTITAQTIVTVTTVDAALQTSLQNSAESDPVVNVAVGQPVIKVELGVSDARFPVDVSF
jgi:hypothetical protein